MLTLLSGGGGGAAGSITTVAAAAAAGGGMGSWGGVAAEAARAACHSPGAGRPAGLSRGRGTVATTAGSGMTASSLFSYRMEKCATTAHTYSTVVPNFTTVCIQIFPRQGLFLKSVFIIKIVQKSF